MAAKILRQAANQQKAQYIVGILSVWRRHTEESHCAGSSSQGGNLCMRQPEVPRRSVSPQVPSSWDQADMDHKDIFSIMMMQKVGAMECEVDAVGGSHEALQNVVLGLRLQIHR